MSGSGLGRILIVDDEQTVRDGRMITAQTWQSHPSFYREIFAQLSGKANAA